MKDRCLVILSGGQDSITCLYWALRFYDEVHAITFDYGQNHKVELECAKKICELESVSHVIIDMSFLNTIVNSALINGGNVDGKNEKGLPSSFVPNRNQLFITLSHSYLQKLGGGDIVAGFCQTDYHGYPDCRLDYIEKIKEATNLGNDSNINIKTPLMFLSKSDTFKLADDLGCLDKVIEWSNTCYYGIRNFNEWGWGCGDCPACKLRIEGYIEYKNNKKENE